MADTSIDLVSQPKALIIGIEAIYFPALGFRQSPPHYDIPKCFFTAVREAVDGAATG